MSHASGHDDYLWDRSGPVDGEVAALERLLAPQRWQAQAWERPVSRARGTGHARHARRWRIALAAAAVFAMVAVGVRGWYAHRLQWPAQQAWRIAAVEGDARIDGRGIDAVAGLAPGAMLETGAGRVRLRAARIGEVVVGEGSVFSIVETRGGRHRTQLRHGSLWARVWAPPGAFGVSTPSGDVLDLGCEFTLHANEDGSGALAVRSGWVQVENNWREVLVPQGARIEFAAPGRPGTPYDEGASAAFVAALRVLDAQDPTDAPDAATVRALAAAARPQDAISLLSLLRTRPQLADGPLFDRMSELMPTEARVSRAAVRAQLPNATEPWWKALPYPRIKRWWTQWPDALPARDGAEVLSKPGKD